MSLEQYDGQCVYFCDSIQNNIMSDGQFIRIHYATEYATLNGLCLCFSLECTSIETYYNNNNKYKCTFDLDLVQNQSLLHQLQQLEDGLLQLYHQHRHSNRNPTFKLYSQFKYGQVKLFSSLTPTSFTPTTFIPTSSTPLTLFLKISGIWETDTEYGLTYKLSIFQPIQP